MCKRRGLLTDTPLILQEEPWLFSLLIKDLEKVAHEEYQTARSRPLSCTVCVWLWMQQHIQQHFVFLGKKTKLCFVHCSVHHQITYKKRDFPVKSLCLYIFMWLTLCAPSLAPSWDYLVCFSLLLLLAPPSEGRPSSSLALRPCRWSR